MVVFKAFCVQIIVNISLNNEMCFKKEASLQVKRRVLKYTTFFVLILHLILFWHS